MGPVQHVVILAFKPEAGPDAAAAFFADAEVMASKIEGLTSFVHGPNISAEALSGGFTHAFIMTFVDAAALAAYLPHPLHEAFKAKHVPNAAKVLVVDI
ncbi:hypothetical protein Rsub_12710 [Raphidocelis subcapitata]|uniref:Stress-response A/B barrel domain-containing protein n=1 Tax=Raphidocelis subcapitata TaxID=307507 RepID=A0A2V0PKA2_9CHLO|nr:hypothetical protein Rsub_12710 [Raphidocelis subcapitata]|eukprot:GBG00225.1 hypothetical protein Rsub_12710 [Raphidocelis subcapitata]